MRLLEVFASPLKILFALGFVLKAQAAFYPGEVDQSFSSAFPGAAAVVLPLSDGRIAVAGTDPKLVNLTESSLSPNIFAFLRPDGSMMGPLTRLPIEIDRMDDLVALPDGGVLLCGEAFINSEYVVSVMKILQDGTFDTKYGAGLQLYGQIRKAAVTTDGQVWIAGDFYNPTLPGFRGLLRLDSDGNVERTVGEIGGIPEATIPGRVLDMVPLSGARILVGGDSWTIDGKTVPGLLIVDSTGKVDSVIGSSIPPESQIRAVAISQEGSVYVIMLSSTLGSPAGFKLLRFTATGVVDPTFETSSITFNRSARARLTLDSKRQLLLTGNFYQVNGLPYTGVSRFLPNGQLDKTYSPFLRDFTSAKYFGVGVGGPDDVSYHLGGYSRSVIRLLGGSVPPMRPTIYTAPDTKQLTEGASLVLSVNAIGNPEPSVLWLHNGSMVLGATNVVYELPNVQSIHAGTWSVVVSNALGVASQQVATIGVREVPQGAGTLDSSFSMGADAPSAVDSFAQEEDGNLILIENGAALRRFDTSGNRIGDFEVPLISNQALPIQVLALANREILLVGALQAAGVTRKGWVKLRADGTLDESFVDLNRYLRAPRSVLPLQDGRFCIAGGLLENSNPSPIPFEIRKSTGEPDDTFPIHGLRLNGGINRVYQLPDGSLVVSGNWTVAEGKVHAGLIRVGLDGQFNWAAYSALDFVPTATAMDAQGRILVARPSSQADLSGNRIIRFLANGEIDPSFSIAFPLLGHIGSLCVDTRGRIVVAGHNTLSVDGNRDIASLPTFIRLLDDGRLDPEFVGKEQVEVKDGSLIALRDGRVGLILDRSSHLALMRAEARQPLAPTLYAPFVDVRAAVGHPAILAAPVGGEGLQWNWFFNDQPMTNQSAFLSFTAVQSKDFGTYYFIVHNAHGAVTSGVAQLLPIALPPLRASSSLVQLRVRSGDPVVLRSSSFVQGTGPFRFRWYRNGQAMEGQTLATIDLGFVQRSDEGLYQCVVSNPYGEWHGDITELKVFPGSPLGNALDFPDGIWFTDEPSGWVPMISSDAVGNALVKCGPFPDLTVTSLQTKLIGPGTLSYRWKLESPDGQYDFQFGLNSPLSELDWWPPPTFVTAINSWQTNFIEIPEGPFVATWRFQRSAIGKSDSYGLLDSVSFVPSGLDLPKVIMPADLVLSPGAAFRIAATIQSQVPYTVQWQHDGNVISGATNSVLTIPQVSSADTGDYRVDVTSTRGVVQSAAVHLTVTSAASALRLGPLTSIGLELEVPQEPGRVYRVEASEDLIHWFDPSLWSGRLFQAREATVDMIGIHADRRYYRTVLE